MEFEEWWEKEGGGCGGELLAEGRLAKAAWNAAIEECAKAVETQDRGINHQDNRKGKVMGERNVFTACTDRIAELESDVLSLHVELQAVKTDDDGLILSTAIMKMSNDFVKNKETWSKEQREEHIIDWRMLVDCQFIILGLEL